MRVATRAGVLTELILAEHWATHAKALRLWSAEQKKEMTR